MTSSLSRPLLFLALITSAAVAQMPGVGVHPGSTTAVTSFNPDQVELWMTQHDAETRRGQLESPSESVSVFDLKAPGPARREYEKGIQLFIHKNFSGAVEHLSKATTIYPSYVAGHTALGCAYLDLGRNEEARGEFAESVRLDDHLPNSYRNLGRAELALNHYAAAQESLRKASTIAPLDVQLLSALTYAEYLNRDFPAAVSTAHQVHGKKHDGSAIVHYFAAASWQGQNKPLEMRSELEMLLAEDPKSPVAETARRLIQQITDQENAPAAAPTEFKFSAGPDAVQNTPGERPELVRTKMQELLQEKQVAEAELESPCDKCGTPGSEAALMAELSEPANLARGPAAISKSNYHSYAGWTLRSSVDEVALFFAVTDHGRSVSDLKKDEISIRDDKRPPASVFGFRNESQLPLRLGLVIDTSASIQSRFAFEQRAAVDFLHRVVSDKNDLAFVVGFSNSVLLVQDFTNDDEKITHGINQLAPAGGTAAWDAVAFASEKLAGLSEDRPVARILVVITDGDDNSSTATLKDAIESAQSGEVIVYTVNTREDSARQADIPVGERALKVLANRTGGAAFVPGSLSRLNHSLDELQQVIRSRYLISYKPAQFLRDGQYRSIDIVAEKAGRKLKVYTRRGYYATARSAVAESF